MNAGLWNEASHAFVGDANIINSETKAVTLLSASQLMRVRGFIVTRDKVTFAQKPTLEGYCVPPRQPKRTSVNQFAAQTVVYI